MPAPRALILSVGRELLLGDTVDSNSAFLGAELAALGVELAEVRLIPDERATIAAAFSEALGRADLVLATGGLGPTHDDLTREGVADALGEGLVEDPRLAENLLRRFGGRGQMPVSNLRQAMRIPSAEALDNPIGSAPGWWVERDGRVTVLMPGVPSEMRRMWSEQVTSRLARRFQLRPLATRTVKTFGIGESAAAEKVGDLLLAPGPGIEAGIYARDDGVHLRFSTRDDASALAVLVDRASALLGDDVYGTDAATLPSMALAALARGGVRTLASAESGTNGALLGILAGHEPRDDEARYVGGKLLVDPTRHDASSVASRPRFEEPLAGGPQADAVLWVRLGPPARLGRSRLTCGIEGGPAPFPVREVRIHGSGAQRLRRAAFAALDQVRRTVSATNA